MSYNQPRAGWRRSRSPAAAWDGPWVAKFADGPQKGQTRFWAVGPPWQEIHLAPSRSPRTPWFIAGGDGIPRPTNPTPPHPGETRYTLRSVRRTRLFGDKTMVVIYRMEKAPDA